MPSALRRCASCGRYSTKDHCPSCRSATVCPVPAKFSPDDRYGEYRRRSIIKEYGENGKHDRL
ncbi:MAG: hypothetical protein FWF07_04375 [Methanomassiliicoccaceae archaeon]|nr:hypothetical protein [Methanomassiliicoccaceae archaeon]